MKFKIKIFVCFLLFFQNDLLGQYATFYADSAKLWMFAGQNLENYHQALEMQWIINGKTLRFGSTPIQIQTDSDKLDTIFYRQSKKSDFDTIICNIKEAIKHYFIYNDCCNAFNVTDKKRKVLRPQIIFQIKGSTGKKTYVGTLDNDGIIVQTGRADTLTLDCTSAMVPNIYRLFFGEVEICEEADSCTTGISCHYDPIKKGERDYNLSYKIISKKLDCLFMPLGKTPIQVIYDPKTNKIKIH